MNQLSLNCQVCSFLNYISSDKFNVENYCIQCNSIIYKPSDEFLNQIIEADKREKLLIENFEKAHNMIPSSFIPSNMIYINISTSIVPYVR